MIDLRSGYWQVRIKKGDQAKTTVVTRDGAFEFLVMLFSNLQHYDEPGTPRVS
ncbi:UNVERIFIED_CONTAM: RNA-directed DNA polymerase [Sesamum angustifolium]|uniref:RNA-directed DNA polymerase n=1 Tax=Sesamum angustifolium TaxID=2727405 RepID=A0AAW2NP00_9LAMI